MYSFLQSLNMLLDNFWCHLTGLHKLVFFYIDLVVNFALTSGVLGIDLCHYEVIIIIKELCSFQPRTNH